MNLPIQWQRYYNDSTLSLLNKTLNIVKRERKKYNIYPSDNNIFNAFAYCPLENTKVIIIGNEPYNDGNTNGLSFGVKNKLTPTLSQIFKCIKNDFPREMDGFSDVTLHYWTVQGVLLLNTCLTVRANEPFSHTKIKWQNFIFDTIKIINEKHDDIVWMLWGKEIQKLIEKKITNKNHLILKAKHPLEDRNWYCNHFVKCNEYLDKHNLRQIKWI